MMKKSLLFFGLILIVGCSSAPVIPENIVTRKNQAAEYINFGNSYYQQAQYDQAIGFYSLAKELNTAVDNLEGVVVAYNALGKSYLGLGKVTDAEEAFSEAYSSCNELNKKALTYQTVNNMAEVMRRRGKIKEALDFIAPHLTTANTSEAPGEVAVLYHTRGILLRDLGKSSSTKPEDVKPAMDGALGAFQTALEINKGLNNKLEIASNWYQISTVHALVEDYGKAKIEAQTALDIDKTQENSSGIAHDYRLLGVIDEKTGNFLTGFEYHLRAYRIATAVAMKDLQIKSLESLISLADKLGKTKESELFKSEKAKLIGK